MKTRQSIGSLINSENRATQPMQTVQIAVPQTRIVLRENLYPRTEESRTPMIYATPVIDDPIVTAFSFENIDSKMVDE